MINTTLNKIRAHGPCRSGWEKLLAILGKTQPDDEPLSMLTIINSNGFDDAVWSLRAFEGIDSDARLFAVACARRVQHLMADKSIRALDVAERYAHGQATADELHASWDASWDASWTAWAARDAAGSAWAAARAARDAAWSTRDAAWSTSAAVWEAARNAWEAAGVAERAWQEQEFKRVFCGDEK